MVGAERRRQPQTGDADALDDALDQQLAGGLRRVSKIASMDRAWIGQTDPVIVIARDSR
jgi:hypothetical protein